MTNLKTSMFGVDDGGGVSLEQIRDTTSLVKTASDLSGYDDTKSFFVDGLIDMTGTPIEVGGNGIRLYSDDYNKKGLFTTDTSGSLFVNESGDYAGDINCSNMLFASTPTCPIFDLDNENNSSEVNLETVNFGFFGATKTALGSLSNYRQWLSNNLGLFNLHDGIEFVGDWTGFKMTNVIGLSLGDITLFQAGAGFNTNDFRFISNKIKDVGAGFTLLDFTSSNINEDDGLQVKLNELLSIDMIPNIERGDVKSIFVGNSGIQNTNIGGKWRITSTTNTPLTENVATKIQGVTTYKNLQHFSDGGGNNTLTYISSQRKEFRVRIETTVDGGANDEIEIFLRHWDNSAGAYVEIDSRVRQISNVLGGLDVGYFNFEDTVTLEQNDRVEAWIRNNDDGTDAVALLDTTLTVEAR